MEVDKRILDFEKIAKNSKRHHWVPQCYLRNFTIPNESGMLFVYQKDVEVIKVSTSNVAIKNNLYTFQCKETKKDTNAIEGMFSTFEGMVFPILSKIIEQKNIALDDKEASLLAEFIAYLIVRGPTFSDWQKNMHAEGYKMMAKSIAENPQAMRKTFERAGVTFKNEKEFKEQREAMLNFDKHLKVKITGGKFYFFKEAAKIARDMWEMFLFHKSWHLLISDSERRFITSDNPVAIQRLKHLPSHLSGGVGFGTVLLTLSPRMCLVLRSGSLKHIVISVNREGVDAINKSIIKMSRRQVYSDIKSKDIQRMCDSHLNGVDSFVTSQRIAGTPYTVFTGPEKDFEAEIFEKYAVPEDSV